MKILALDSSGIVASVAVVEDDTLLAEYTVNYKKTHSQTLLPMLDEIVKMTELELESIDAIAVDALAYNLYDAQGLICPIMDARRKQVYTGIYRFEEHQLKTLKDQWAAPVEELLEELNRRGEAVTFLGDGVPVFRELIAEKLKVPYSFAPAHVNKQRAAAVAALGSIYYKEGRTQTDVEHVPEYLRVSQAERERAEREKAQKQAGTTV